MIGKVLFATVASVLAVIGNTSYLKETIQGKVSPHPYTWFIWSIVSLTTFFGGLEKGAGIGALPTGIAEGFTILIFLFALFQFRKSKEKIHASDHVFFVVAILGLIPWYITKDPTLSVVTVVCIDVIAFIPTLRKAWQRPDSEHPLLFGMNVLRHALTLFALSAYNVATTFHSVAMIITNTVMVFLLARKKK